MTPNLDGVEVEGRRLVAAHVHGTPGESVLFHSLKARERLQRPLTEYLSPGSERKAGTAHAESGRIPTAVPLTLCEHTVHQGVVHGRHGRLGNSAGAHELAQ